MRGAHGRNRERDVGPVLAGGLHDLGAANQFERRLSVLAAGVEPRVIDRRPARAAHRIGDAQHRRRRSIGVQVDADFELLGRRGVALGLKPGDLAVEVALLDLGVTDRVVGGGDLLGDGRERGAPFAERPGLALLAKARGRRFGETLGELAARRRGRDLAIERRALSRSASMRRSICGRLAGGAGNGGRASTAPITRRAPPSPSTRSDDGSSVSGKSWASSVESPAGRSSADQAGHRCAVRIDGDGVDLRTRFDFGGHGRHSRDEGDDGNE